MSGTLVEERKTISFVPDVVTGILGSVYCLVVLFILLIIPILQVAFGAAYRNQCPINSNISVYLIVSGACGIATILLTIIIAIAFICLFKKDSKGTSFITGCIIGIVFLILFLMSLFLSPWFIVGNVWIFGVYSTVDLDNTSSRPLAAILGSVYCLVILCILLVIPILQLAIGASFQNQCPVSPNIPTYLIVSGACGIATILLTIIITLAFILCIKRGTAGASIVSGCIIGLVCLILFLMSFFLFAWFIVGNVWVFSVHSKVDLDNPLSVNYCQRTLYQFAFTIIIMTYVMSVISCCCSCFRSCCEVGKALKK
ncbi:unnamed protein product [Adineta steineri]|uniref:Uncharacterized protein n=1 Tax=Adineta steineri TaxID=433720 RepID=A0A819P108_9BILA|nr:unnamed protein product [Adineta steineri]